MHRSVQIGPILGVASAGVAFVVLAIVPAEKRMAAARAAVRARHDTIAIEAQRVADLPALFDEVAALRTATAGFSERIPPEAQQGALLADLAVFIENAGLENHILQPQPTFFVATAALGHGFDGIPERIGVQPVRVQCEGRLQGVVSLLAHLEEMPRLSRVAELNLMMNTQRPAHVNLVLILHTYYVPKRPAGDEAAEWRP